MGVELAGFGYYLERRAQTVIDPLFARAVMLESDGKKSADHLLRGAWPEPRGMRGRVQACRKAWHRARKRHHRQRTHAHRPDDHLS